MRKFLSFFLPLFLPLVNRDSHTRATRCFLREAQTAARKGDLEYFQTLLDVVDDPISFLNHQEQSTEQTPLLAAALAGQTEIVNQLLEIGVDVTIPEKDGYTVMHAAAISRERKL